MKLAIHYIKKNATVNGASPASKGSIVCTASNAGLYPFPVAPIYAAGKAGVINLVRSLARPLSRDAIQINALAPAVLGMYSDPMMEGKRLADVFWYRNEHRPEQGFVQAHDCYAHVDLDEGRSAACF